MENKPFRTKAIKFYKYVQNTRNTHSHIHTTSTRLTKWTPGLCAQQIAQPMPLHATTPLHYRTHKYIYIKFINI